MRKFLAVLFVCLLALPLAAQTRTGNIYGTVVDSERNPLPGVNVTLTGPTMARMTAVTSAAGKFRFLSLFPGNLYQVKAELEGFKTKVEQGVVVNAGVDSNITVVMEMGALEEEVTVTAATPVVTPKRTQITHTATYDMLQSLPSARDPWVVLQMLPSVLIDRENVGGSESGQQSGFVSKGETTDEWVMDGIQITDLSSISSPTYFDFDMFEEISVTTGMTDVEHRERSIVVSFVSRRGGNKFSFGGRFYLTDEYFQMDPSGKDYEAVKEVFSEAKGYPADAGYNHVIQVNDFGFNMGGPLWKEKIWWWGSYGVQQIKTTVITGSRDDTYLNNYAGKLNFQLFPGNRAEIFLHLGDKKKYGRDSTSSNPPGRNQHGKYHWGSPIFKLQDEHMFGDNLFVSVRYGFTDAGFGLWPAEFEDMSRVLWYNYRDVIYEDPWGNNAYSSYFFSGRPHQFGLAQAILYVDDLFGTSHEMKLGLELNNNQRTWVGGNAGNFYFYNNYVTTQVDWNRDGIRDVPTDLIRFRIGNNDLYWKDGTDRKAIYFQDIITAGRFNFNIQLRMDRLSSYYTEATTRSLYTTDVEGDWHDNYYELTHKYMTDQTIAAISGLMTDRSLPEERQPDDFLFWSFSPRVGITYDLFGDGKTILKAAFAMYPGGPLSVGNWARSGGYPWFVFWWADAKSVGGNGDWIVDLNELYWAEYKGSRKVYRAFDDAGNLVATDAMAAREKGLMWGGFEWATPTELVPSYDTVDPNWKNHRDYDVLISLEREIFHDFGVGIDFTYRWDSRRSWELSYYPEEQFPGLGNHKRSKDDYMVAGTIPDQIVPDSPGEGDPFSTKEAAGKQWYVLKDIPECQRTDYGYDTNRPDRHDKYWGLDIRLNKRFSNKWMLNGSFTYQMQKQYYGDNGYTNPNSLWAFDGQMYTNSMGGGSGKISVPMFSRWLFKLQGMYALPYGFNVSFSMMGREGMLIDEWFDIIDYNQPNRLSQSASVEMTSNNNEPRLPNIWMTNLKVEKMLKLGDTGRVWFSMDVFNALNNQRMNRQRSTDMGNYYISYTPARYTPYARSGEPNESVNPLILRFGLRFQF